jgi:hypothetical protein
LHPNELSISTVALSTWTHAQAIAEVDSFRKISSLDSIDDLPSGGSGVFGPGIC